MNVFCGAVAIGREDLLPLGQGSGAEFAIGARARACQRDECVLWRPPDIWSSEPYDGEHRTLPHEGVLFYRPSEDDSEDLFGDDSGDEAPSQSADDAMEVDE